MELYKSLFFTIKNENTGLLKYIIWEICIIFQSLIVKKPKYVNAILKQIHIINIKATDSIFQGVYLANILVNSWGLLQTFYKMDLLLEYQNKEFK